MSPSSLALPIYVGLPFFLAYYLLYLLAYLLRRFLVLCFVDPTSFSSVLLIPRPSCIIFLAFPPYLLYTCLRSLAFPACNPYHHLPSHCSSTHYFWLWCVSSYQFFSDPSLRPTLLHTSVFINSLVFTYFPLYSPPLPLFFPLQLFVMVNCTPVLSYLLFMFCF